MDKEYYKFYQEVGRKYPEEELSGKTLRGQVRYKFVLSLIQDLKGSLLDIGCNRGMYLAEYAGGRSYGIDISVDLLRAAKDRKKKSDQDHHFLLGDAENLDFFRPGMFDNILCSEVLEHLKEPEKVLRGIYRILKPGGNLILTVPNYRNKKPAYISSKPLEEFGVTPPKSGKYYHTAYKVEELSEMVENCKLKVVESGTFEKEVKYATRIPVVLYYIVYFINKTFIKSRGIEHFNDQLLVQFSKFIYKLSCFLKLDKFFQYLVKEGVRTFVIAKKTGIQRDGLN